MHASAEPEITFIVPCFNYARYLGQCLDSIFAQRGDWRLEVIVIDDASTDDTWEVMQGYGERIRAIRHAVNKGHAGTITEGLEAARGAYVARIDPDDRLRPEFLEATASILRAHPEVGLVYGDVALIDDTGRETSPRCDVEHGGRDFKGNEFVALLKRNFICAPAVLARRQAWLDALPIPEKLAFNDWHFTTMIARRWELYFVNRVVADYRVHSANLHHAIAMSGAEERSVLRVLDRYYGEKEESPALERQKRREGGRIYSTQYISFARKYFGNGQYGNARRCYLKAIAHRPAALLSAEVARHLLGTLVGPRIYHRIKRLAGAAGR